MFVRLSNYDERNLGAKSGFDHLHFESRFESGNLRKAIKVSNPKSYTRTNCGTLGLYFNTWFLFRLVPTSMI